MPKQGWEGLGELLRDLYRELTPVLRTCLFAGMGMGFLLGLYLALGVPEGEGRDLFLARIEIRIVLVLVFGLAFLGAFIGLAAGVALELAIHGRDRPDKNRPWWKSGKSSRRKG